MWDALEPATRGFVASGEAVFRAHRDDPGFDFSGPAIEYAKAVETELKEASGLTRLNLLQERRDLEVELAGMSAGGPDLGDLEKEFVKVAKPYAQKKGISYGAWREFGVAPEVLKKAGITRGS